MWPEHCRDSILCGSNSQKKKNYDCNSQNTQTSRLLFEIFSKKKKITKIYLTYKSIPFITRKVLDSILNDIFLSLIITYNQKAMTHSYKK